MMMMMQRKEEHKMKEWKTPPHNASIAPAASLASPAYTVYKDCIWTKLICT